MAVNQARRDLREKLIFERQLLRKLNAFGRKIGRALVREYSTNKQSIRAESFRAELEEILIAHYKKVGKSFSNRLTEDMPKDIAVTSDERKVIDDALSLFYIAHVGVQSTLITETTQKDIDESFATAFEEENEAELRKAFSITQIATIAATNLIRKLSGRNGTIAAYETQVIAESAKATEGQVLSGNDPSVLVGTNRPSKVKKEWVTMGDDKVRMDHVIADGQVVDDTVPYDVGGEQLMYPGDSSLGASAGNIINCRCASVYDKETVYAERHDSAELLESIRSQL